MAKITYDVSSEDAKRNSEMRTFDTPDVGVYPARIASCDAESPENKNPRLHVVMEITKVPKGKSYPQLHEYIVFTDSSKWKLDQFLQAVGVASVT